MLEEIVPTKYCPGCKKEIPMTGYYKSNANAGRYCISCLRKNYEEKKYKEIMSNGGSERISPKPNTYVDEFQKAQTFMVLERLGWIYNDNGVWSKEGVKDKDNNWVDIIPQPKVKRRPTGVLIKKKHGVHKYIDKIIQQREEEKMTYADLADIYDCSHTTIRMIVSKYYNEKKTR